MKAICIQSCVNLCLQLRIICCAFNLSVNKKRSKRSYVMWGHNSDYFDSSEAFKVRIFQNYHSMEFI